MNTGDTIIWTAAASIGAAVIAGLVALAAAWVSHSAKISEFRQAWINALRQDISDYVGAAEKWHRKWEEINSLTTDKESHERDELFPIANEARVILWRIRLRFNPREADLK